MSYSTSMLRCTGLAIAALFVAGNCFAGNNLFNGNNVGGVSVDALGVVEEPSAAGREALRRIRLESLEKAPAELAVPTDMRMVSLKGLEAEVAAALRENPTVLVSQLPDEIKYLAGLQRIKFVFVYPEKGDIVLAGPGEGWKVDDKANVVGVNSGRPVLRLEDLMVVLRTINADQTETVSCSIDPTAEGRQALDAFLKQMRKQRRPFNDAMARKIEQTLGPQEVTITGVDPQTRFARFLVAADYRMKRIAMNLEESPVAGLPSFLDLMKNKRGASNMMPRWWLACNYEPVAKSDDGLAWEIRGQGVKAMTEDDVIAADGTVAGTGRKDPVAQRWADLMTEKYDELSAKDVAFAELRNLMDMSVVSALIAKYNLLDKAGLSLPMLMDGDKGLTCHKWNAPKTVPTQVSAVKRQSEWVITASGGVDVDVWAVIEKTGADSKVAELRTQVAPKNNTWRWN